MRAKFSATVLRADVKDLIFPGNLQEIMNRVLTAERLSQAQLVEARTKVRELEALSTLRANPAARIYIGFDKHLDLPHEDGVSAA